MSEQSGTGRHPGSRYAEVVREILSRNPEHRIHPTLERVREACHLLGDPQLAYRVVHITGTNGKTSTSRMVERLVREHDLRTGRFTSPHLSEITERIAIDGEPLSRERFVAVFEDVEPVVRILDERAAAAGDPRLSFFEVLTLMAFWAFADAPVDVAVVEVGLGGTWDTTNVVQPDVCVVTPVSVDHEAWLGSTIAEIAENKAGIIKHGATVVLAAQEPEADEVLMRRVVSERCSVVREGVDLGVVDRQLAVGGQLVSLRTRGGVYADVLLPLHGVHQAHNAAVALSAAEALLAEPGSTLGAAVVEGAFADVDSPGRMEVVRRAPAVVLDAAHNPGGAKVLAEALAEAFTFNRLVGVVAVAADKDAEGILAALEPVFAEVVVTRSSAPRSLEPADLAEIAEDVFGEDRVHVAERADQAIDMALGLAEADGDVGGGVVVTGSVVLAGDVRTLLRVGR
ncbi:dihydrofolate synthase/folylpolyglutamate synthase [Kineococcus xinjiangensis]|uniref:Dihydrofolate synthase/folylpolyglutamate synthase n=1 Tax=Kineococcus xinjiangensis TaxID=512762 RepID=A0A2S6IJ48_9ACTN|nr:folylpolyglutamate synthase/dihydrofolate synthase family protein [Kineococcus xinjiangensis]PPK94180.1 dihydrofolate synthase/folylpolyglutamate synthase [Kineococcus xinjiangensis]